MISAMECTSPDTLKKLFRPKAGQKHKIAKPYNYRFYFSLLGERKRQGSTGSSRGGRLR